jgi:SAM-dependent methyltransferase
MSEAIKILGNGCASTAKFILDLGCGTGGSFADFSALGKNFRWIGLDIADSPEVRQRTADNLNLCTYDGVHIPIADHHIDLIYSHQVLEHVRWPAELLDEVHRVLKPGGYFVGSTSHLEPFHSCSFWNFTPHGFAVLLRNAGFRQISFRPGIDGITLIARRLLSCLRLGAGLNIFFEVESPLNVILEWAWRMRRIEARRRNAVKLLFCGHFCFVAQK